jgi:hypothetical protein
LRFQRIGGERNDITQGEALMAGYTCTLVLADKGYDTDAFLQVIRERVRCR